jgi:hypothetical protein
VDLPVGMHARGSEGGSCRVYKMGFVAAPGLTPRRCICSSGVSLEQALTSSRKARRFVSDRGLHDDKVLNLTISILMLSSVLADCTPISAGLLASVLHK